MKFLPEGYTASKEAVTYGKGNFQAGDRSGITG